MTTTTNCIAIRWHTTPCSATIIWAQRECLISICQLI